MSQVHSSGTHQSIRGLQALRRRENLWITAALLLVMLGSWGYTIYGSEPMSGMSDGMMVRGMVGGALLFLLGWIVMMVAMMIPATLPLILLYKTVSRAGNRGLWFGMTALVFGYFAVWALAGLPVYVYNLLSGQFGLSSKVLPAGLLVLGGLYQFTALKRSCHSRCSSPLFFLMQHYKPRLVGAARLGVLHGMDCLGCCAGLMVRLVALGMMNLALMITATVIIFAEKTLPIGHRLAKPLGVAMVVGGVLLLAMSLAIGNTTMM